MANKSARSKKSSGGSKTVAKGRAASASKKVAAKTKVRAASRTAKKAARFASPAAMNAKDRGLMTAFHHMQRASAVMSLVEKGKGKDLRELLERGVNLYRKAMEDEDKTQFVLGAIGVLRAAEHLSFAGLYLARRKYRPRVSSPIPEWLGRVMVQTGERLVEIERAEREKDSDLYGLTVALLQLSQDPKIDAHLAFELAMAADALCFAMENGL
jgi:hypothetical protein